MSEPILKEISKITGILLTEDELQETWKRLDAENRLNQKTISLILLAIVKKLNELEK